METSYIFFFVFAAVSVAVLIWYLRSFRNVAELKLQYSEALKGTDRKKALAAGRAYYRALRYDGRLNEYAEMSIANDLSVMKCREQFPDLSEVRVS